MNGEILNLSFEDHGSEQSSKMFGTGQHLLEMHLEPPRGCLNKPISGSFLIHPWGMKWPSAKEVSAAFGFR